MACQVTDAKNRLVEALNGLYNLSTEIKVDERQLAAVKQSLSKSAALSWNRLWVRLSK
ncbi:hypothetical protein [Vibrio parahaemolyticus]|uniref:hypothetical protein n=1 Tax=Vibrio parahaemolyticus TaxID=670 RepID=UPI001E3EEB3B|nr:hypothetical protein [Vibrio parahaemolyticus]